MNTQQLKMMEPTPFSADEAAIRNVLATLSEAWNKADVTAFASVFTEDVDYVTFMGTHLKGIPENVKAHQQLWNSTFMKGSRLEGEVKDVRFLNETTAIVHAVGAVKLRWQKKAPTNRLSISTNVLVKRNGQWLITAFHNCRIQKLPWFIRLLSVLGGKKA